MFQDEAGFGRINKPKYCWCEKGIRPSVPCHHIREYRYAYGAVEPTTGEGYFLIMPYCNTVCMNIFLKKLSKQYSEDINAVPWERQTYEREAAVLTPEVIRFIEHCLAADEQERSRKQHHTARRIYNRLVEECSYMLSCTLVLKYLIHLLWSTFAILHFRH